MAALYQVASMRELGLLVWYGAFSTLREVRGATSWADQSPVDARHLLVVGRAELFEDEKDPQLAKLDALPRL
jgi:hypothetical protein